MSVSDFEIYEKREKKKKAHRKKRRHISGMIYNGQRSRRIIKKRKVSLDMSKCARC